MQKPLGIMAQFEKVSFKKDGVMVFEAVASIGCIRSSVDEDNYKLVGQGHSQLFNAVKDKKVAEDALDYTSVEVCGRAYTKTELARARAIPTNRGIHPSK